MKKKFYEKFNKMSFDSFHLEVSWIINTSFTKKFNLAKIWVNVFNWIFHIPKSSYFDGFIYRKPFSVNMFFVVNFFKTFAEHQRITGLMTPRCVNFQSDIHLAKLPDTRCRNDIEKYAGKIWQRIAQDRQLRKELGKAYFQQWTYKGWWW